LQFSAKAAIQTASMMFSILRRKVARCGGLSENWKDPSADFHVTSGSSGTVAITDPAVDDVGNVSHN
jgi:hypothetical protein